MKSDYDDTKAVARLPNLEIEILHRRPWQGDEEMLSITLRAKPSFEAFFQFLEAANPFALWMRTLETAWSPWLRPSDATPRRRLGEEGSRAPSDDPADALPASDLNRKNEE